PPAYLIGRDTDEAGMCAALKIVELHLDKFKQRAPNAAYRAAIIGRGAVTPAVRRALKHSAWHLVYHAGARAGWSEDAPQEVDLIINAAGPGIEASRGAPRCHIW